MDSSCNIKCHSFNVQFLERNLDKIEMGLSTLAAIPIVGIAAGVAKFALGGLMICGSVGVYGASSGVRILFWKNRNVSDITKHVQEHCKDYIKHGFGNLSAAIFEGIPILGTILFFKRVLNFSEEHDPSGFGIHITTEHEGKFQPYRNLIAIDAKINENYHPCQERDESKYHSLKIKLEDYKRKVGYCHQ